MYLGTQQIATIDSWSGSIRHAACEMILPASKTSVRCKRCTSFRGCLRVQSIHLLNRTKERTNPGSCVPYSVLSSEEMQTRMRKLHNELRRIQKQHNRLKDQLSAMIEKHGVTMDEQVSNDLKQIMQCESRKMMERAKGNTFQHLFWKQQELAASKQDARGMRWHPLMIKWCIYLRYLSQGAYETMRSCISLPSQRTLRDYTHHLKPSSGFSYGVDHQLYSAARLDRGEELDKYIILLLDEIYVKEDLVFDKITRVDRIHKSGRHKLSFACFREIDV